HRQPHSARHPKRARGDGLRGAALGADVSFRGAARHHLLGRRTGGRRRSAARRLCGRMHLVSLHGLRDNHKKLGRMRMAFWFRVSLLAGALALFPAQSNAQNYPARPITVVVGYTPGAVSDLAARTISEGLNAAWGQPVIVDNRPGSGSNIAAGMVARA